MTGYWMKRSTAALGAVAALTAAPLAASIALPAGVPGGPAVASAGPACMADPFSRACQLEADDERQRMAEESKRHREQMERDAEENRPKKLQEFNDDLRESHCKRFPQDSECRAASAGFPWGKVVIGIGVGLLALIAAPFVFGAIAASSMAASTIREIDAEGFDDDEDLDDFDDEDGLDDDDLHVIDYPDVVPAPAPAAAPAPTPGPAPAAGPPASTGGASGLWGD